MRSKVVVKYEVVSTQLINVKALIMFLDRTGSMQIAGSIAQYKTLPWHYEAYWEKNKNKRVSVAIATTNIKNEDDGIITRIYVNGIVVAQGNSSQILNYTLQ